MNDERPKTPPAKLAGHVATAAGLVVWAVYMILKYVLNHVVFGVFVGIGFLPFQRALPTSMNLPGSATP